MSAPGRHDVAVIGGGVIGLAVARALCDEGLADIVVIERHAMPGAGSTSRANGGVRAQFSTRPNIEFSLFTIAGLERLQRESGGLPGFVQAGYLLFTGTEGGEASLRRGFELQRSCGVDVSWLGPEEVSARAPFIRADGLRAGTFGGKDGLIDPHGVVAALQARIKGLPITMMLDTEATGIAENAAGFSIATSRGEVRCRWLVNAAGPEAADVAALLGVDLPCHPVRRNLACTDPCDHPSRPVPDVIPMCVDLDTGVLIRRESGGFLIAWSNPADPPGRDTSLDPLFLGQVAERIGNRFPFLESAPIREKKCWAGLYPETPDHHAILGPAPGHPRFVQCAGFGGHGIMHSLAAGRAVAELIARGRATSLDIHPLRFERFAEGDLIVEAAVL